MTITKRTRSPSPQAELIGPILKLIMQHEKVTVRGLEKKTGHSRTTINRLRNGKGIGKTAFSTILDLLAAIGCKLVIEDRLGTRITLE